jgi:hypothetical protein
VELFNLQPFSNIDPAYANPPYTEQDIPGADRLLGFSDDGTSGFTSVSQWFNPAAIAQLAVNSTMRVHWGVPYFQVPGGLAEIDYTLTDIRMRTALAISRRSAPTEAIH